MTRTTTPRRATTVFGILALVTAGLAPASAATTAEGSLDTNFNGTGVVMEGFAGQGAAATAVAVQSDGKIVVAGFMNDPDTHKSDFAVARDRPDGQLDTSFDGDGRTTTAVGSSTDTATAVAIQPDGKIIVAGDTATGTNGDFAVIRYKTDGKLDTGFGTGGMVITDINGGSTDLVSAVALQPDGNIVVAGSTTHPDWDFAAVRYKPDGTLDPSFGPDHDGKTITKFSNNTDSANVVVVQPDGKIVAAGSAIVRQNGLLSEKVAVVRYKTDGTVDLSFSGDGKTTTDVGPGADAATGVTLQADSKIVVGGYTSNGASGTSNFIAVRYNADGSLDSSFDGDGEVITDIAARDDDGMAVAIQPNDKIVVAGDTYNGSDIDFAVVRYNVDGNIDDTFDGDGNATTDIGADDRASAVAIQPDGKIVAVGSTTGGVQQFAVVRYIGDATPPFGAHMVGLPANTTTLKQTLQWTANDDNTGVKTFDVRQRGAAYTDTAYGAWTNFRTATALPAGTYTGTPGTTVCFEVRARDVAGNLGVYGTDGCVAYPVDDPTATATGTWATASDTRYYGGSARTSSTAGATLNVPVDYRHLGIVVEKCNGCGTVQVLLGTTVLATLNTNSAATSYKAIVPVDASTTVKTGTLHIKQTSAGKLVTIDGITVNLN